MNSIKGNSRACLTIPLDNYLCVFDNLTQSCLVDNFKLLAIVDKIAGFVVKMLYFLHAN